MKSQRHEKILELIKSTDVETQEDLTALLKKSGFNTTQATVSRDIKELKLIKVSDEKGKYKYAVKDGTDELKLSAKFQTILKETVIKIDVSTSLVVIKTFPAMAQAAASAIDNMKWDEIAGTIAGDDTIFVALKTAQDAEVFCQKIRETINL